MCWCGHLHFHTRVWLHLVGSPAGRVNYGGWPSHYCLSPSSHIRAYHLWLGILPCTLLWSNDLSPSFSLKHISLFQNHVSQHQFNCAHRFIIFALLSVHFTVGLVLDLSISLFEVLLHLFHISRDTMATCICTNHGKEKVYREVRSPPEH